MTENQALPSVKIEINSKEYTLLYTLYAFAKLKKIGNLNALKGEVDFNDPEHVLYFLWSGLVSHHPELDGDLIDGKPDKNLAAALKDLGTYLTISKMNELGKAIREAFTAATRSGSDESSQGEAGKKQ
jgi:hypothetical protein